MEFLKKKRDYVDIYGCPDDKVHWANMGPTWVLSAPDGPHVGPWTLLSGWCFSWIWRHFLTLVVNGFHTSPTCPCFHQCAVDDERHFFFILALYRLFAHHTITLSALWGTYLKALNLQNACKVHYNEFVITPILSIILCATYEADCFQLTIFSFVCENSCTTCTHHSIIIQSEILIIMHCQWLGHENCYALYVLLCSRGCLFYNSYDITTVHKCHTEDLISHPY